MSSFQYRRASYGFGSQLTPIGKRLLILYSVIYVLELFCEHWFNMPFVVYLKLYPLNSSGFHVWQILTHPFLHNPNAPIGFLINCLVFYFFAGPVEQALGTRRFLYLFYLAALGGALCGLAFSLVSGFNSAFLGMMPSLLTLIVVFGLLNPEATILLMFILPIKAKFISYGTVIVTLLTFLAKVNPHGAYHLGGILFGYVYFQGPRYLFDPNLIRLRYMEWQMKRRRSRFTVVDGSKNDDDHKPTYH